MFARLGDDARHEDLQVAAAAVTAGAQIARAVDGLQAHALDRAADRALETAHVDAGIDDAPVEAPVAAARAACARRCRLCSARGAR